jgi:hypothetical protein
MHHGNHRWPDNNYSPQPHPPSTPPHKTLDNTPLSRRSHTQLLPTSGDSTSAAIEELAPQMEQLQFYLEQEELKSAEQQQEIR